MMWTPSTNGQTDGQTVSLLLIPGLLYCTVLDSVIMQNRKKQVEHDVDPLHERTDGQTDGQTEEADYIEPALSSLLIPGLLYLKADN